MRPPQDQKLYSNTFSLIILFFLPIHFNPPTLFLEHFLCRYKLMDVTGYFQNTLYAFLSETLFYQFFFINHMTNNYYGTVDSSVGRAVDCRGNKISIGRWFNSGSTEYKFIFSRQQRYCFFPVSFQTYFGQGFVIWPNSDHEWNWLDLYSVVPLIYKVSQLLVREKKNECFSR